MLHFILKIPEVQNLYIVVSFLMFEAAFLLQYMLSNWINIVWEQIWTLSYLEEQQESSQLVAEQ